MIGNMLVTNIEDYKLLISEGLILTQNIHDTIYWLNNKNKNIYSSIIKENKIKISFYDIHDIKIVEEINYKLFNLSGWFPASCMFIFIENKEHDIYKGKFDLDKIQNHINNITNLEIIYEAKFDLNISFSKFDKIYHITPTYRVESIIKNGLIPKSNSKLSNHPERVYFMKNKQFVTQLLKNIKLNNKKETNKIKQLVDNYFMNKEFIKNDELDYTLLEISNLDNYNFYRDINYNNGVYTLDNINPKDIKILNKDEW